MKKDVAPIDLSFNIFGRNIISHFDQVSSHWEAYLADESDFRGPQSDNANAACFGLLLFWYQRDNLIAISDPKEKLLKVAAEIGQTEKKWNDNMLSSQVGSHNFANAQEQIRLWQMKMANLREFTETLFDSETRDIVENKYKEVLGE